MLLCIALLPAAGMLIAGGEELQEGDRVLLEEDSDKEATELDEEEWRGRDTVTLKGQGELQDRDSEGKS